MEFVIYYGKNLSAEQKKTLAEKSEVSVDQLVTGSFENHKGFETPTFFCDRKHKGGVNYKAPFMLNLTKVFHDLGVEPPKVKSDCNYAYAYATICFENNSQRHVVETFCNQKKAFDEEGKLIYEKGKVTSPLCIKAGAVKLKITKKKVSQQGYEYFVFEVVWFKAKLQIKNIHVTETQAYEEGAPDCVTTFFNLN